MSEKSESTVQIDENNLDRECIKLPTDYLRAAYQAAEAKRNLVELENELSVVEARLGKAIRAAPEDYELEKVTETAIASTILTQTKYKEAQVKVNQARYDQEIAQALVWAMEHKKRALTLLVDLHGMGYFSKPKVSQQGREAVEQMTQRSVRTRRRED